VIQNIRVVREICDVKINAAVVVVIAYRQTHAGLFAAIFIERHAGWVAILLEGPVSFVDVELLRCRIVNDYQIKQIVIVGMHEG
jgi:hypothetical protein